MAAGPAMTETMCTVVILRRPGHDWPLLLAANRDEMADRPWRPPGRHWPDREHVVAGLDETAGGTWLALNDVRIVAAVLNRSGSLGPDADKRSRGELPLEAVDHAEAKVAAEALARIEPDSYRSFNMVIADAFEAFWIRGDGKTVTAQPIPEGLSMITAHDLNDTETSERIRDHLPNFRAAPPPDPEAGDWATWQTLMAALCVEGENGFGTVSASLIALPSVEKFGVKPHWLFCPGRPDEAAWSAVDLS
mgnify:CR=1 FL=1